MSSIFSSSVEASVGDGSVTITASIEGNLLPENVTIYRNFEAVYTWDKTVNETCTASDYYHMTCSWVLNFDDTSDAGTW